MMANKAEKAYMYRDSDMIFIDKEQVINAEDNEFREVFVVLPEWKIVEWAETIKAEEESE